MYATSELGEVRIMVCRSMLASDSGEMDSALFLLSRGVSRGLEKRDTAQRGPTKVLETVADFFLQVSRSVSLLFGSRSSLGSAAGAVDYY